MMNINQPLLVRAGLVLVLAGVVFALCRSTPDLQPGIDAGVIMKLPEEVDGFTGKEEEVSDSELQMLPGDTTFAKMSYTNAANERINTQIVLAGGEKRSIHRPEVCLPAQGWTLKSGEAVPITLANGQTLDVMRLTIARPVQVGPGVTKELTSIFLYWFVGKNMTTPYHWQRLAHSNWDRVVHNVNHRWAYVITSAAVMDGLAPRGKDYDETMAMLEEFVGQVAPQIMEPSVQLAGSAGR